MIRVLNALFDDRYGGPQKRVIDVGVELKACDVETTLLLPDGNGNAFDKAAEKGIQAVRLPFHRMPKPKDVLSVLRWLLLLPKDIWLISRVIRDYRIDLVHVNGAFFVAPAFAAKLSGRKLIWHLNDTLMPHRMVGIFSLLIRSMSDGIIVAAEAVARHYRIAPKACQVIYAPVDVKRIKPGYKRHRHRVQKVGLIGNWNPLKGIDVFVEIASLVRQRCSSEVEFHLVGARLASHSAYAEKIDALIREKGVSVHCRGFVEDIPAFLSELDVLVLTSWSEACPMAVLEAMAAGVPVVATDVGGVREILRPDGEQAAGFVIPPGDARAGADKVVLLLESPELATRMGKNGRILAEKMFSLDKSVERHEKIYHKVLRGAL